MLQIEINGPHGLIKNKKTACEPVEGFACGRQGVYGKS